MATHLVVHGHFYQPPRENPWTEDVVREASAAPFHDWNARITAECYRPNAWARIVDERGRVVAIVNNYESLSFDVGPTLTAWLEHHAPEVLDRIEQAEPHRHGGMAQAYFHVILPLAPERDVRTLVRWGVAEFRHRFGRRPDGLWLPETAVNDMVLGVLAEEGVGFTILAPTQAERMRPLPRPGGGGSVRWIDVRDGSIDTTRAYRWVHPAGDGRGVDVLFYDGDLSHRLAFEPLSSQALIDAALASGGRPGLAMAATDGETFGHHRRFADRGLAYALSVEAPRRGLIVTTPAAFLAGHPPAHEVSVRESAWSCAHGVGRWKEDCGCSTGGEPGWNQRWRAPLRQALDRLWTAAAEIFERRAGAVLHDPWLARDAYVEVLVGASSREEFAAEHVTGDAVEAFTLLEAQRHAMAMYTSCGWFFNDLANIETVLVLRHAARVVHLLGELGEQPPEDEMVRVLAGAESNDPAEGDGADVWHRHVVPARVDAERVVAHLALVELLHWPPPEGMLGGFHVDWAEHDHADRGTLSLCSGRVVLTHRRTGRHNRYAYAALRLGGLEVLGAVRPAEAGRDEEELARVRAAFSGGMPVTAVLRLVGECFGPTEFDLSWALPGGAEQILESAARSLVDRFVGAFANLYEDHRPTLSALAAAGYPLPPELRAPAELVLARRFEAELAHQAGSWDPAAYRGAVDLVQQASESGIRIDTPAASGVLRGIIETAVARAVQDRTAASVDAAVGAIRLARDLGLHPDLERAQEWVYEAALGGDVAALRPLGTALGLAMESLGVPR